VVDFPHTPYSVSAMFLSRFYFFRFTCVTPSVCSLLLAATFPCEGKDLDFPHTPYSVSAIFLPRFYFFRFTCVTPSVCSLLLAATFPCEGKDL